jgi:hypothetical protein
MNKNDVRFRNKEVEERIKEANLGPIAKGKPKGKSVGKQRVSHQTSHEYH